jgi:hypothetical protein
VVCSVFDWDRIGRDEYVGSVHVPVAGLRGADPRELSLPVLGEQGQVRWSYFIRPGNAGPRRERRAR